MCTAEDIDIKIFYQDTDSMHIEKARLNELAIEYKKRFNRELIGKNLGQFHNDFDEVADGFAYHSIFLGKKAYIDMLINDKSEHSVHYRMKGVSLDCIELYANEHNMSLIEVYDKLLHNESITFDLLSTQPRFKYNKNRTMTSAKEFKRKVSFNGDINSFSGSPASFAK